MLNGEVVSPPAGAIGRGDAFLLRIAEKTGATVLSNDSFQEFHGEHEWVFERGRLIGGKPVPGVDLRIANPDSRGIGEVVARGPNVMIGYTDEEATRRTIDAEGWLHTGDLGRIDRKGRLEIVGRLKDVVISQTGENVYPDDVENRLGSIDGVTELAVVGVEVRGSERLACLAVPGGDREAARAALRRAIDQLPPGQRPAIVHLSEAALPRTATRKVKPICGAARPTPCSRSGYATFSYAVMCGHSA